MHPATSSLLRYFEHAHLKPEQAAVAFRFSDLAHWITDNLPAGPETTVALRKLLESKDAAVRASLEP
jgi:hypothetical protein